MNACSNSSECGAKEDRPQTDTLSELRHQVLKLLQSNTILPKLQLLQMGSYYLDIQSDELMSTADQQQLTSRLSDSELWFFVDQQRLQSAMNMANTHVKLLLNHLSMLSWEITKGCQELEAFITKFDQGLVDSDIAATVQQKLQQISQYMEKFESGMNLGPLYLQIQLIPNTGPSPMPELTTSLFIKMPVEFDRFESSTTSSSALLFWEIIGQQSQEPNEQFEVRAKSLNIITGEYDQFTTFECQSYNLQINNLIPDSYYQFSVKRVDVFNLVYGLWIDTITLKTLDSKSKV